MKRFAAIPALLAAALAVGATAVAQVDLSPTIPTVPVRQLTSTDQADAEADVSLAYRALHTFCPTGSQPPAGPIALYEMSLNDLIAGRYNAARTLSVQAIGQCAALATTVAVQQEPGASASP